MANTIKPIPSKARELLEAITKEFGIEVIRDFIKIYEKRQLKRMKKYNTKEEVAYDVYKLMFYDKYSRTRAIDEIAIKRHLQRPTINNHLNNFNQEAKKNNFYTLGWIVDKIYDYANMNGQFFCNEYYYIDDAIELLAKANDLEKEVLETYYWRYKTLTKRERAKYKINLDSVIIPDNIKCVIPKEYLPKETIIKQETNISNDFLQNNTSQNNTNKIKIDEDEIPF